jgi:DNA-binding NtrC family response regulator
VPIALPPLRARREDIPGLARHFLARVAEQYGLPQPALSADAERALASREWTGNVRELRNLMERTLLLSPKGTLNAEDFAEDDDLRPGGSGRIPFPATLAEMTRAAATAMLELCAGNKRDAARRLAISRSRLQRILDSTADLNSDLGDDGEAGHE